MGLGMQAQMKIYTTKRLKRFSGAARCCITVKARSQGHAMEDGSKQCAKYIDGGGVVETDGTPRNYCQLRLSRFPFSFSLSPLLTIFSRDVSLHPAPWKECYFLVVVLQPTV